MGLGSNENVVSLADKRASRGVQASRVIEAREVEGRQVLFREATDADVAPIQALYVEAYHGKYAEEFAVNPRKLCDAIHDPEHHLWLVAEDEVSRSILGAIVFLVDAQHRLGKAAGIVVAPAARSSGIGGLLLKLGVQYLSHEAALVDVLYAMSRTVNEAPSRVVAESGFHQMGLFPNAVQVDNFEHLNLDVFLTEKALAVRRRKPYLFPPFDEIFSLARAQLGLEGPTLVTERAPLVLSDQKIPLEWIEDEARATETFQQYRRDQRLSNCFFPFHRPNRVLRTADGGTEVFVWFAGRAKQAAILGYRTDRVNIHDLLDAVAAALQKAGAAYVELLVDAYNYKLQQEAFTARYIPSAYFPAMMLAPDGLRDDFFILSRTFHLLDFTGTFLRGENLKYLRAYLRFYHDIYLRPILG